MSIDLHIHTTYSDGQYSPREIFSQAKSLGLTTIAIADHNTIEAVAESLSLSSEFKIGYLPAVELSTYHESAELHLLGYCIDPASHLLADWLRDSDAAKIAQTRERTRLINELGIDVTYDEVATAANGRVPNGVSFLTAIRANGRNLANPKVTPYLEGGARSESPYLHFYYDFFSKDAPAFVRLDAASTTDAIDLVKKMGGIPVLAHPAKTPLDTIETLMQAGLAGVEAISTYHTPEQVAYWKGTATDLDLIVTAGSDYHGPDIKPNVKLGGIEGNDDVLVERLLERLQKTSPHSS